MPLAFPAPAILLREWVNAEEEVYSPSPASPITPTLVIDPAILNEYDETRRAEQPSYSLESEQAHMNGVGVELCCVESLLTSLALFVFRTRIGLRSPDKSPRQLLSRTLKLFLRFP